MSGDLLVAVAVLEFALAAFAIYRGLQIELVVLFVLVLLMSRHGLAPAPLLVAGAAGYVASVLWRLAQVRTRFQNRVRLWLFRRGFDPGFEVWPRTPIVIASGTSLALVMPDEFTIAAAIGLALASAATSWEWRRRWFGPPLLGLTIAASTLVLGLAVLLAVAAGTVAWASPTSANDVLPQLITVQIALGFLPLTALSFAVPFVAGAAGAGAARALPWPRVAGALVLVLLSIAFDVFLLGSAASAGDLEWAEIGTLGAITVALLVAVSTAQYLQPGRVAYALVQRLNAPWLQEVRRKYQEPFNPWFGPDPFRDVERLLYIAATRESDIRLFNTTLRLVLDRLSLLVDRLLAEDDDRTEVGLDEYFARALSALIEDAGRQGKSWVLDTLVRFRRELSDRAGSGPPAAGPRRVRYIERTFYDDPNPHVVWEARRQQCHRGIAQRFPATPPAASRVANPAPKRRSFQGCLD